MIALVDALSSHVGLAQLPARSGQLQGMACAPTRPVWLPGYTFEAVVSAQCVAQSSMLAAPAAQGSQQAGLLQGEPVNLQHRQLCTGELRCRISLGTGQGRARIECSYGSL